MHVKHALWPTELTAHVHQLYHNRQILQIQAQYSVKVHWMSCHSEPKRSGGKESRCHKRQPRFARNETPATAQDKPQTDEAR
jgi:hypothetical protein